MKTVNNPKISENERLAALVAERTKELEETHKATLLLLDKLQLSEFGKGSRFCFMIPYN